VRFRDNPYVVVDPGVRFYAGAPLTTSEGLALGTLCVVDGTPRRLDLRQLQALRALSGQVTAQLELRRFATAAAREMVRQQETERLVEQLVPLLQGAVREPLGRAARVRRDSARRPGVPARGRGGYRYGVPDHAPALGAAVRRPASGPRRLVRRTGIWNAATVDLNLLVDWAVREVRPIADAKDILIRYDAGPPSPVYAQPRRLSQSFGHLLFTAVKYTPSGGRVTVRVENTGAPTLELHDVGAHGEPTHLYEHVLNGALRRPWASDDGRLGADAGLTAVKAILDLHHATVALHDSPTEAPTCIFAFPPAR
jgi:K+-sensing histidine kinase KdpD